MSIFKMNRNFHACVFTPLMLAFNLSIAFGQRTFPTNPATFQNKAVVNATTPYLNVSADQVTLGPTNGDTTSIIVTSNLKWKVNASLGWIKTNPAWITIDGDSRVKIILDTQWLTQEDITGEDLHGSFTIEEDSQSPTRIIKTINCTLKAIPGSLVVPIHNFTFKTTESTTVNVVSNLGWNADKRTNANWLKVTPSYALSGTTSLKLECISANAGSKDNTVWLILSQTKGTVKDSILLIQQGTHVGITDFARAGIKYYPQPAGEMLYIDLPQTHSFKDWTIYSPTGKVVSKGKILNQDRLQIPLHRLPSGIYFFAIRSETDRFGMKFTHR